MRSAFVFDQLAVGNAGRSGARRGVDRHGLIVGAVDDQRRDGEGLEVGTQVGGGKRAGAGERGFEAGVHRQVARPLDHFVADRLRARTDAVKVLEEAGPELRAVGLDGGAGLIEHRLIRALGVVGRFQHVRHDRCDEDRLLHIRSAVARQVAGHLAAAHRETQQGRVAGAGLFEDGREVIGQGVVVVAVPGLLRSAEPAAIVGNGAQAGVGQRHRQVVERG